jgi:hypothetical protein
VVVTLMRNTTVCLARLTMRPGLPWSVGAGFNTHIAALGTAETAPVDAADQALAAAGITRTSAWRPHPTRGAAGWLVADALDDIDYRPDLADGDDTAMHIPNPAGPTPALPTSSALDRLLDHTALLQARRRYYDVVQLDPNLPGDEYRADLICGPDPDSPTAVIWYRATSQPAAIAQARAFLAAQEGPDDRFAEVFTHNRESDVGEYLTDVHLGA